jgi:(S)-ureidoglycine-glyoxylate aminotransferase
MTQTSALYRGVFQTENRWTLLVDGTARSAIEAALVSLIEPGDRVLVPVFGRFGNLLVEIATRCGAEVRAIEAEWGTVFSEEQLRKPFHTFSPKIVAVCHGDTSTTMAQPLEALGKLCREHDALLYVDATATLGGVDLPVDRWHLDVVTAGLQKSVVRRAARPSPLTTGPRNVSFAGGTSKRDCKTASTKRAKVRPSARTTSTSR